MIMNGLGLLKAAPILRMLRTKEKNEGYSHGLSEVGYDLTIKQKVDFIPPSPSILCALIQNPIMRDRKGEDVYQHDLSKAMFGYTRVWIDDDEYVEEVGRTALASSIEEFSIPNNLWCEFRNKSTWARQFVDATLGTDGEPGWSGNLTIEAVFHGQCPVTIPAGVGILKAVFHQVKHKAQYTGKYQNQPDRPVPAITE